MIQPPLFADETKESTIPKKIINRPGPLVKKSVVISRPVDLEIPYRSECEQIFNATSNRMYIPESNEREIKDISDDLVGALEKTGRPVGEFVSKVVDLLKAKSNLYSVQGIQFVEVIKIGKKLIRR